MLLSSYQLVKVLKTPLLGALKKGLVYHSEQLVYLDPEKIHDL